MNSFSFTSTAEVVALVGAHPIFIDVDDTYNICLYIYTYLLDNIYIYIYI